ncbi:uncharacterized protein LOC120337216 isoform X3 [Styela clava]
MEYFDVSGSETSFDTVTLLSTSLPIQSQKRKKRRRRHRSDDTDFLLLQPAESILLPVTHLINISHHVNNEKENSPIQERHCTIIDGYRFYQYRNSSVLQGCLKDSSMKCQEQHPNFSAILAKHGISYDMSPNGKSTKDHGGAVCRDAADRLLDAMDEQLHDVLLANVGIEDVNDDPGVDPDSVRSLRNRVMYDLAAAEQKKPAFEVKVEIDNEPVPRKQDEASDNNKRTTTYRSASASRYGQRSTDIGISNDGFHNPTQKPLASSLDRLEQHSTDRNQSASLSARNTSDSRKGRDYERSRDRRRLNGGRSDLPRSSSVTSLSTVQTEEYEDRYKQMMVRHLAGVPVTSFDSVTIASDLDSVHTDAVREHFLDSMRKHKDSSIAGDLNKPMQNETIKSQRLRDRYIKLKDQEKQNEVIENGADSTTSSKPTRSPIKSSYRPSSASYLEGKSDPELQVTRTNDSIHTNDSVISQNGVLPSRCRTPSRQSNGSRHHSAEVTSSHHRPSSSSKASSRHSRAHSVGPTNRSERTVDADDTHNQYYTNDVTRDSSKPVSRQSYHRSDSIDSANDRRKITSNALNKLQELDSQIEEIESKKKTSEQELKLMEKTMEGHRINLLKLEEKLRENQAKADDARTELMVLEFKKDQCRKDLDATTKEFNTMQDKVKETEDLGMSYDDIVALMQERDDLRARFRRGEASRTSITERQELERALHTAKEDLFRERKLTRERVEELEEKMEDVNHSFEIMESEKNTEISRLQSVIEEMKKTEAVDRNSPYKADRVDAIEAEKRNLFEKIDELNKLLQQKNNEIVSLATETNRSREENRKLQEKVSELESKMSEQIELREKLISETERNTNALKKDKEHAIAAGKQEKEHEIQRILEELEKEKSRAVLEYKSEHQEEICRLRSVLENKDKEIEQLRGRLNHEDDAKRALGEKLRMDAKEQVRSVLAKERLSWEQEKQIADKREDDSRRADFEKERTHLNSEVEEARNKCKIATEQISRLRTEIEELRLETRKLLQEKLDAATQAREHERRDQNKKMDQLRAELEEMNQTEIEKQRSKYNKLEEEMRKIKHEKNDALLKCKEANSNSERNERCFTVEVYDECQKIGDLIRGIRTPSQSRNRSSSLASRSGSHLSRSNRPTNAEGAVSQLRALSDDVRATLRDLTTEVETHRRAAQIAQRERDMAATNSGQSRNSTSSSNHLSQQIAKLNGHNSEDIRALSKQLSEKDNELRDIQRNMCMWKDTTAQKLAQKFEEELAVQLERKLGRHRLEHKRQIERMEEDLARLASSHGHLGSMHSEYDASSSLIPPISSTPVKVAPANGATGDKGTVKLLRHLQGRVKQLRAENDLLRSNSQIMDYEGFRKSR